jgi:hypothetical protein
VCLFVLNTFVDFTIYFLLNLTFFNLIFCKYVKFDVQIIWNFHLLFLLLLHSMLLPVSFLIFFCPWGFWDGGWVLLTGVAFSSFLNIHHMEFHVSFWVNFTYENIHTLFPLPDLTDSQLVWSWIPRVNERQPISIARGLHGISAEKCTWTSTQTDYNRMIFPGESFIIRW